MNHRILFPVFICFMLFTSSCTDDTVSEQIELGQELTIADFNKDPLLLHFLESVHEHTKCGSDLRKGIFTGETTRADMERVEVPGTNVTTYKTCIAEAEAMWDAGQELSTKYASVMDEINELDVPQLFKDASKMQ